MLPHMQGRSPSAWGGMAWRIAHLHGDGEQTRPELPIHAPILQLWTKGTVWCAIVHDGPAVQLKAF